MRREQNELVKYEENPGNFPIIIQGTFLQSGTLRRRQMHQRSRSLLALAGFLVLLRNPYL